MSPNDQLHLDALCISANQSIPTWRQSPCILPCMMHAVSPKAIHYCCSPIRVYMP